MCFLPSNSEICIQEVPLLDYQAGTKKRKLFAKFSLPFFFFPLIMGLKRSQNTRENFYKKRDGWGCG